MRLAADVKPEYGPTLPDIFELRLGGVPKRLRSIAAAVIAVAVLITVLLVVRGGARSINGGGHGVSFSFSYAGLQRENTPPGQYVLLAARRAGRLAARITVGPLHLPDYAGNVIGIEPVIAANYMRAFAVRTPGVVLQGAAPTAVDGTTGYNFTYTRRIAGSDYYGRVIFITPPGPHPRQGLTVSLLAQPVLSGIIGQGKSALAGALYEPGQGGVGVLFQPAGLLSLPLATLRVAG
ncbi:MAG TPA: hypothetical protein VHM72_11330 [Solirubrobacteraceae bacterium]|jgi:hypothetical protein|nr:hypothetical protein [Solirubrobacteraceae bacterium]